MKIMENFQEWVKFGHVKIIPTRVHLPSDRSGCDHGGVAAGTASAGVGLCG